MELRQNRRNYNRLYYLGEEEREMSDYQLEMSDCFILSSSLYLDCAIYTKVSISFFHILQSFENPFTTDESCIIMYLVNYVTVRNGENNTKSTLCIITTYARE